MENKISPAFSLSSEKVTSRDNWLDLGIHSIDQSTFNMQGFRFPDHPYLRINSILVENFLLHKIDGPNSILGRGVIIHAGADDLTSQPTGAAGARLGIGVIGVAK